MIFTKNYKQNLFFIQVTKSRELVTIIFLKQKTI